MRWKLICVSAALIAVSGAQLHTIENTIVIHPQNQKDDNSTEQHSEATTEITNTTTTTELSSTTTTIDPAETTITTTTTTVPAETTTEPAETTTSIITISTQTTETSETTTSITTNTQTTETSETTTTEKTITEGETTETKEDHLSSSTPALKSSEESDINESEEIETTHGPVIGYRWQSSANIIAYYDIPYGTFKQPFDTPVTAESWSQVHNATAHTTICPQLDNDKYINEPNCLTLSIFTPKDTKNASVLFHIYDSHANYKSADPLIYGPDHLVPRGIILVLPNYRVGPMGFLCMQNETAPGNAGLKDLLLALEWVRHNIRLFGGEPSNIVVSGDGAAGAYAGYLAICARSKYYIDKVITESGSTLSHWALDRDPKRTAYDLAEKIRAVHSDGFIYNNTFAEASLETILKASKGMRFKPCIENGTAALIDDTPWNLLRNDSNLEGINSTTFMIGSARFAGTHEAASTTADLMAQINEQFDLLLPEDLVFQNDAQRRQFASRLREQYFENDIITANDIEEFSLWHTDASYLSPGIRLARALVAAGATVYMYEYAFVGNLNRELEALQSPVDGAVRGDLTSYLFHKDKTSVAFESPEQHMIQLMVDLWASFINSGKPTAENVEWHELKEVKDEEEEWLVIETTEPTMKKGIYLDRLRLWTSLYAEHFIDNSGAINRPHYFTLALMCLMANKINYNSQ